MKKTLLFLGLSLFPFSSIFSIAPAEAFNLRLTTTPLYVAEYFLSKDKKGKVWINPIKKIAPPSTKLLNEFKNQFPTWEWEASYTPIYGDLVVDSYRACIPLTCEIDKAVGSLLNLDYIPKKDNFFDPQLQKDVEIVRFPDPNTGRVQWVQWVESNHSLKGGFWGSDKHGVKESIIDTRSNNPFYYGEHLGQNSDDFLYFLKNKKDPYGFYDTPARSDIDKDHQWKANLFLAYQKNDANGNPNKVQVFGGISWGWNNIVELSCPTKSIDKTGGEEESCPLDVALVFDTTGSMGDEIEQVKNSALELVDRLFFKIPDSRVAVIDYRDFPRYPYGSFGDYPYNALLPFSDHVTDITGAINRLSLGSGGDWPESAYSALMNTLQGKNIGGWREEAEKAIILFTDAPPHDPEPSTGYTLDSVIAASRNPVTIQSPILARSAPLSIASSALLPTHSTQKPVSIYSVVIGNDPEAIDYLSKLSEKTGGKLYNSTDIVDTFFDVIFDIGENLSNPDTPSQSVPEPSPLFGLLALGVGKFLPRSMRFFQR